MSEMVRNRGIIKRLSTPENIKEVYEKLIADGKHENKWDDLNEDGSPRWIDSDRYEIVNDSLFDVSGAPDEYDSEDDVNEAVRLNDTDYRVHAYYYNGGADLAEMLSSSIPRADDAYENKQPEKMFYAVKILKNGNDHYWSRGSSPAPNLFLTEGRALGTVKANTAYTDDELEVVRFVQQ